MVKGRRRKSTSCAADCSRHQGGGERPGLFQVCDVSFEGEGWGPERGVVGRRVDQEEEEEEGLSLSGPVLAGQWKVVRGLLQVPLSVRALFSLLVTWKQRKVSEGERPSLCYSALKLAHICSGRVRKRPGSTACA